MSIEETFRKHIDYLLTEEVEQGHIRFSYLQGRHTVEVSIAVEADYGKE